jgi:hypothetical protein
MLNLEAGITDPTQSDVVRPRLDRRQFLRGGALTVAGIGTLSAGELLRPAAAQAQNSGDVFNVQFHDELTTATPVRGDDDRLRLVRHVYEFDFRGNVIPPVDTFRIRRSPAGKFRLPPVFGISPFDSVQQYVDLLDDPDFGNDLRRSFPPPPGRVSLQDEVGPQVMLIYRTILRNADGQSWHLIDWGSFYSAPKRDIEIHPGNGDAIQYSVDEQPNPNAPRDVANYAPVPLNPWATGLTKVPFNHTFFAAPNQAQTAQATVIWDVVLNADPVPYKVEVFVPAITGKTLTKNARYLVTHEGGQTRLAFNQQTKPGAWMPLLDANNQVATFRFATGSYEVSLANDTGENQASTIVVADGIRWRPA